MASCTWVSWVGRGSGGAEGASVLGWGGAQRAQGGAPHGLGGAEAAGRSDRVDAVGGVLEQPAGGLDADALDVAGGGGSNLGCEPAGEAALAHPRDARQPGEPSVPLRCLPPVALRLPDSVSPGPLPLAPPPPPPP